MNPRSVIRILFVCRGSTKDGLGHVMRSRAVAAVATRQMSVRMAVIGEPYVQSLLNDSGLDFEIFQNEESVLNLIKEFTPEIIVCDALKIPDSIVKVAKQEGQLLVGLSPVCDKLDAMDLLFHRTIYAGKWNFNCQTAPRIYAGLEYTVVRENCLQISEETYRQSLQQNPLAICVSMGGADAENKTLQTLRALRRINSPLLIWTFLGEGYAHSYEKLVQCVQQDHRHEIILAKTNNSMWRVMKTCSLALLAGGTVTYEAVFAGLPSINLFDSANHMFLIRELVEKEIALSAGFPLQDALDVAMANVSYLEKNRDQLLKMHQKTRGLIDNLGCQRMVDEMVKHLADRPAVSDSDSSLVFPKSWPLAG
jgi:spore coat polysaccharide biosynthesis predicted glycosyltransferase SpsG